MRTLKRFHMAIGSLLCFLGFLSLSALSPSVVCAVTFPAPLPTSPPLTQNHETTAQVDSLSRSLERLHIQVDSELKANNTRIESIKEATDRSFWTLVILGIIGSIIGGAFVLGERAQERQHHKDYTNERAFYEQRAQKYEQRQQEFHEVMLNVSKKSEDRSETAHFEIVNLYQNQVKAGRDAIEQTSRLFALVEANFAKINEITTAVANGAKENVSTLNAVLASFQQIMQFKVTEAQLVEQIRSELNEMERTRKQQVDELLKEAIKLIRKRFEFTNPDPILQRLMVEFRTKMDNISMATLMKYTKAEAKDERDWRYGEIFLRRGVIAITKTIRRRRARRSKSPRSSFLFPSTKSKACPQIKDTPRPSADIIWR